MYNQNQNQYYYQVQNQYQHPVNPMYQQQYQQFNTRQPPIPGEVKPDEAHTRAQPYGPRWPTDIDVDIYVSNGQVCLGFFFNDNLVWEQCFAWPPTGCTDPFPDIKVFEWRGFKFLIRRLVVCGETERLVTGEVWATFGPLEKKLLPFTITF